LIVPLFWIRPGPGSLPGVDRAGRQSAAGRARDGDAAIDDDRVGVGRRGEIDSRGLVGADGRHGGNSKVRSVKTGERRVAARCSHGFRGARARLRRRWSSARGATGLANEVHLVGDAAVIVGGRALHAVIGHPARPPRFLRPVSS